MLTGPLQGYYALGPAGNYVHPTTTYAADAD